MKRVLTSSWHYKYHTCQLSGSEGETHAFKDHLTQLKTQTRLTHDAHPTQRAKGKSCFLHLLIFDAVDAR